MALSCYNFPEALLNLWWKPLELAGFTVDSAPLETALKVPGEAANTSLTNEISISYLDERVGVSFDRSLAPRSNSTEVLPCLWLVGVKPQQTLAENIERIFLASGAKTNLRLLACRDIYLVTTDVVEQWAEFFRRSGFLESLYKHRYPIDYVGTYQKFGISFDIFVGRAINPMTAEIINYLAINYSKNAFNSLKVKQAASEIETILASHSSQHIVTTW